MVGIAQGIGGRLTLAPRAWRPLAPRASIAGAPPAAEIGAARFPRVTWEMGGSSLKALRLNKPCRGSTPRPLPRARHPRTGTPGAGGCRGSQRERQAASRSLRDLNHLKPPASDRREPRQPPEPWTPTAAEAAHPDRRVTPG